MSFGLLWGEFFVNIPFTKGSGFDFDKYENSHKGFYWFEDSFVIQWNKWSKHIQLPFIGYEFEWHKVLNKDGNWVMYEYEDSSTAKEDHQYTYKLSSGEVQKRTATCHREKRQWHRRWLPFIKLTKECIDISFDDEVGERSGSWKGGTTGCGYDLLKGESIKDCLMRMQAERKF